jgi:hypothetical protein
MSSRLLSIAAAMVIFVASGAALACPAGGKSTSTDGSQGSGAPTTTEKNG